jgi:hypothetical protein
MHSPRLWPCSTAPERGCSLPWWWGLILRWSRRRQCSPRQTSLPPSARRSSALCNGGGGRGLWWVLVGAGIREGMHCRGGARTCNGGDVACTRGLRFYDSKVRILCHQSAEIGAGMIRSRPDRSAGCSHRNQRPAHGHAHPAADWVTKDEKRWISRELLQAAADSRQNPRIILAVRTTE